MSSADYLFLTGSTGFVGSHALRQLTRDSAARPWRVVKALVRSEAAAEQVRALGAEPVQGDLLELSTEVREVVAGARYVVHCADTAREQRDAEQRALMDENLIGAVDPTRGARFVYVCGSSYFGAREGTAPIDESTPPQPIGRGSCFEAGLRALRAAGEQGLDYVAAFVSGVYGANSWFTQGYLSALEKEEPILVLDPPPTWPYVHIDDCAQAFEFLLTVDTEKLEATGREVIIADDTPIPMTAFIEELAGLMGKTARLQRLEWEELKARLPPFQFTYLSANMPHSNARLRNLGFTCRYPSVREGIRSLKLNRPD